MISLIQRASRYHVLIVSMLAVFGVDQLTKLLVVEHIPYGTYHHPAPIPVIEGFLYWVHIGNTGAAWGMFQGFGMVLAGFALLTIIIIFIFRRMLSLHLRSMQAVFGLLIGGILGNLYDRVTLGHVVDFIDVQLPFYRWPAFNIADSAICVGVVCYIYLSFRLDSPKPRSSEQSTAPDSTPKQD
ncbi:MAG: signal peptidase II [Puniceicoccaceae bacterium]